MRGHRRLSLVFAVCVMTVALQGPQATAAQTSPHSPITPAPGYGAGTSVTTPSTSFYLYPHNLHLTAGAISAVPLTVIDNSGNTVPGSVTFHGYDTSLISISGDGHVTALRAEGSTEIGTWVSASVNGVPAASTAIVRVLSTQYGIPFTRVVGENTVLYYPTPVKGEDLSVYVTQYEMPTLNEYAYAIQAQLMGVRPFAGARQIFEVDFGESEDQRVCGISGNPIRLGWNIAGNTWQNCFLVPFIAPRSPQLNVMYHEMGHNFTWASQTFGQGLGRFEYSEGVATAISIASIQRISAYPGLYPLGTNSRAALQQQLAMVSDGMSTNFQNWLDGGADFSQLTPDIVDGIWLHYQSQRPDDFAARFFRPLQPQYSALVSPILSNLGATDQHTIFAALISAARGQDLSDEFSNTYHYPMNSTLFAPAYAAFLQIMDGLSYRAYLPAIRN
jgi:hypothetical protein